MSDPGGESIIEDMPHAELSAEARRNLYNKLARTTTLGGIYLTDVSVKINPSALGRKRDDLTRSVNSDADVITFDKEKGVFAVKINWKIRIKFGRKVVGKIDAGYMLVYRDARDFPKEIVEIFVNAVAKGACYAYFRSLVSTLDWSAGVGSAPLPVIKIDPKV